MKKLVIIALIICLGVVAYEAAGKTEEQVSSMFYYGCPNSKRINKLKLRKG